MEEKIIKTTGKLDSKNRLTLDVDLPFESNTKVNVTVSIDDVEIDDLNYFNLVSSNTSFDFLKDPEEDIYTLEDGKPFQI
jgi:hypothetical protein